jgi:fatty-acyl-CoA synthase
MTGRFGIPRILEFYGSTEGNVSMFNFDGRPGAIGRCPRWLDFVFNVALVRFDVETEAPVRGPDGLCAKASLGVVGECLGRIAAQARTEYTGYVDAAASRQKVLTDVFANGDRWFRTGDLMTRDRDGYYYFVDRVGDTFRWKGENVSTIEVAQHLAAAPRVVDATVYGVKVPGQDGRAGMAALVTAPDFDIAAFAAHVSAVLTPFAAPVFVRLTPALATTGTFKHRKLELVNEGFDPAHVTRDLFVRGQDGTYTPLTPEIHADILAGRRRV